MENLINKMTIKGNKAIISKYEVIEAFFRTEYEENFNMANELNKLINLFYEKERKTKRNVTTLSFDLDEHQQAISYIKQSSKL